MWLDEIDFVVKSFLRPAALERLLRSIVQFYPDAHITVADDGGLLDAPDPASESCRFFMRERRRIDCHEMSFDLGLSAGRNFLVRQTQRPYLLLLDDDFCFTEDTDVALLMECAKSNAAIGVVGGLCRNIVKGDAETPLFAGGLNIAEGVLHHTVNPTLESSFECDIVLNFALFRRNLLREVQWDGGMGAQHYDFFMSVKRTQWRVLQCNNVQIDHYPAAEALPGYRERRDLVHRNQQWLLNKWGLRQVRKNGLLVCKLDETHRDAPLCEGQSRDHISSVRERQGNEMVLGSRASPATLVLTTASASQEHPVLASASAVGRERWNIDDLKEVLGMDEYSQVVLHHVLEYCADPLAFLRVLSAHIAGGGSIIADVTNVRTDVTLDGLLQGTWRLSPSHEGQWPVRFFTRRELEKLSFGPA